jgi:hypothetical protein
MMNLAILIAALAVIAAGLYWSRRGAENPRAKAGDYVLMALGAVALLSYTGFKPHATQPNDWDLFHYYIGSKYFPEIGYTRLYACVARAEAENDDEAVSHAAKRRTIRDLETNELVAARGFFFDENYCKERFSAARWESFKSDTGFFRARLRDLWELAQVDHGFNPSPVWVLAGGLLSGAVPLSDAAVSGMVLLDVVLLFGSVACLAWAFGLPAAAFAAIASTASGGIDWSWAGGGVLRLDWFFLSVLAVCLMKRGHYALAGAALGYAAALRVFPAIFALGPFIALLYAMARRQPGETRAYLKFFAGMAASAALLLASVSALYGTDTLRAFASNTSKHSAVVSTNNVGLRTVLTYRPDSAVRNTIDVHAREAHLYWKWQDAKAEAKKNVVPAYLAVVAVCLPLFVLAVISGGAWQALALGATFVPFAWSEMSNYYYLFLMIVAALFAANRKVAFPLLGIGIATCTGKLFEIDINRYFEPGVAPGSLPGLGMDEVYTLFSAAVCVAFPVIWWQLKRKKAP